MNASRSHPEILAVFLLLVGCTSTSPGPATYAMKVESVRLDPQTSSPILLLEEETGLHRRLPIWIGIYEAQSIALGIEDVQVSRPNTHDLIQNLLKTIRGKVLRVVITELRDNTYYALLEIESGGRRIAIDSRPSDAIAVAVRTGAPVFATEEVLSAAGLRSDDDPAMEIYLPTANSVSDDFPLHH
jgi:bifunctional DNase/RNase